MTREEAIQMLNLYEVNDVGDGELDTWYKGIDIDMREAIDMAIEALSAEPIERISDNTIVVKYADYEDIGRIILTNGDIFCKMFYEEPEQDDDSDYDSLVPDEYKTEPSVCDVRHDIPQYCSWSKTYENMVQSITDGMRKATEEERKSVNDYIESISHTVDSDLISRADAIWEVLVNDGIDNIVDRINALPSAEVYKEWIGEDMGKTDLISRAEAMNKCKNAENELTDEADRKGLRVARFIIGELPSAEQVTSKLKNPCDSLLTEDKDDSKEQKSKLDLISRADAIEALCHNCAYYTDAQCKTDSGYWCESGAMIMEDIPSADRPTEDYSDLPDIPRAYYEKIVGNMSHEINMLKQQLEDRPTHDCTDLVQWLLEATMDEEDWRESADANGQVICRKLKKLGVLDTKDGYYIRTPLAYDDRPSGEWVQEEHKDYKCSICGTEQWDNTSYCPSCGARMENTK